MQDANSHDIEARAAREREAYDAGLKRSFYEQFIAFRYDGHPYWHHRYALIADLLRREPPKRALELGSTAWRSFFANSQIQPEELHCINISQAEIDKGNLDAHKYDIKPKFHLMDSHKLDFDNSYFDLIYGIAILHHLDMEVVLAEIERVLRPGGLLIFLEPLNFNPLGKLVRLLTPSARTADERAFTRVELAMLAERFACEFDFEEFLSVPVGILTRPFFRNIDNAPNRVSYRIDEWLKKTFPALGPHYRRVLIIGRKSG